MDLISIETFDFLYSILYAFLALATLLLALTIDAKKTVIYPIINSISSLIVILFIFLVGFRGYDVGTDTSAYYLFSWKLGLEANSKFEIFFYNLVRFIKYLQMSFTMFLLVVAFVFFLFFYLGFKKIAKIHQAPILYILLVFFSMFFVKSMSINVIRQGVSLAILFYGYTHFLESRNVRILIICSILAFICHTTSIIPIILFAICFFLSERISIKYFYALFFIGILLSAANLGILNVAPFLRSIASGEKRLGYLTNKDEIYQVGFKPQFVAFNSLFLLLSYFIVKYLKVNQNQVYTDYIILKKYYILTSFIFFMAFQIPYSDRWGLFSWMIIPVLIAPGFSKNIKFLYKTIFTLMFIFIYIFFQFYGNIK